VTSAEAITIVEVGPRDGLQYERAFFPTDRKIALINTLMSAGLTRIEVGSFVHPKAIPQFADILEVLEGIERPEGVVQSVLVPNVKGCERAISTPVDELALFVSASETHNRKNVNMSVAQSLAALATVAKLGRDAGKRLRGYVVTAFGCPYEGRVPLENVRAIIDAYRDMGVGEVSLGDTTGMANPRTVAAVFPALLDSVRDVGFAAHFHNSRGTAIANAVAAWQAGVRVFDCSAGGVGGCPTALGAMGNIPTEDLVSLMEEMGIATGVDLDRLLEAGALVQRVIAAELPSHVLKVGRPRW
jgi:hydroxymethylglutaryl-CoA lyase